MKTKHTTKKPGPKLAAHLATGIIKLQGMDYYGIATDGKEVWIGYAGGKGEDQIEMYLTDNPNPSDW